MGPTNEGISIPTQDTANGIGGSEDQGYGNVGRSPKDGGRPRRSRSRSPGKDGDQGESGNPGNNLHVSGLSYKVDQRDLEAAFTKVGRVQKASVMYDPHTRESRGFGFVTMETAEEADAAIAALNATELMGKTLKIQKARRGRARTPTPGKYHGPQKRREYERYYDPRPYDSRYARDYRDEDRDRRGRGGGGRYEDPRDRYYDRDREKGHREFDRDRDHDRRYDERRY